jgi:hypothetical protein
VTSRRITIRIQDNVDIADFCGRECYLAVGAGAPLYEALLTDADPCTVISAAYVLAFFPAHAFASCRLLLRMSQDECQHDIVLPPCDFYSLADPVDPEDPDKYDVRALLMPDPQFPWGSLVARLQKATNKTSAAIAERQETKRKESKRPRRKPSLPDPASFSVKPGRHRCPG